MTCREPSRLSTGLAHLSLACVLLLSITATGPSAFAKGRLWIVSRTGCPLVDFPAIQPAIDAAQDGDTILVRPATYPPFTLDGKGLVITGDGSGTISIRGGPTTIQNQLPGQSVLLSGLGSIDYLTIQNSLGWIVVEDTTIGPRYALAQIYGSLQVTNALSVVLQGCTVQGTTALVVAYPSLGVTDSAVSLYDCTVTGIAAAFVSPGSPGIQIWASAPGMSALLLSNSQVTGGTGANGVPQIPGSCFCSCPGPGGDGIVVTTPAPDVFIVDSTVSGGQAGTLWYGCCNCPGSGTAPPGVPFSGAGASSIVFLPGNARTLVTTSPILENQAVSVTFQGDPGDTVYLAFQFVQGHLFLPNLIHGILVPLLPAPVIPLGTIPGSGTMTQSFLIPPGLVNLLEAQEVYLQGVFSGAGGVYTGSPVSWVVLDENHDPKDGCP